MLTHTAQVAQQQEWFCLSCCQAKNISWHDTQDHFGIYKREERVLRKKKGDVKLACSTKVGF